MKAAVLSLVAGVFLTAQESAKPKPSLDETIRAFYKRMKSESPEEQIKALKAILPARKDIEVLFPKHVDAVWSQLETVFKEMEATIGDIARDLLKKGEITEIKFTDLRAEPGERYTAVFEMIPKDIPAFNYVLVQERGKSGGGTYLFVNSRWILLRSLAAIPNFVNRQK